MKELGKGFPSIREFIHCLDSVVAICRADVKRRQAFGAGAEQGKELAHGRPNIKLRGLGQLLKFNAPKSIMSNGCSVVGGRFSRWKVVGVG